MIDGGPWERQVTEEVEVQLRRRRYENPPVVEAIARFQWAEPLPWTFTTPGLLFEHLRDLYPDEPQAQALMQAGVFAAGEEPASMGVAGGFELRSGPQRIMFRSANGARLLGVSPTDISVHGLPPYEGWENLRERLAEAVERLHGCTGGPRPVSAVGVRYINRIEVPAPSMKFEDYLTIGLTYPPGYPSSIVGFLDRVEMEYPEGTSRLAFTWASTEAPEGSLAFIFDLDLNAPLGDPVDIDSALVVLDDLKVKEGQAFEGLLRDRLRDQFVEIG